MRSQLQEASYFLPIGRRRPICSARAARTFIRIKCGVEDLGREDGVRAVIKRDDRLWWGKGLGALALLASWPEAQPLHGNLKPSRYMKKQDGEMNLPLHGTTLGARPVELFRTQTARFPRQGGQAESGRYESEMVAG